VDSYPGKGFTLVATMKIDQGASFSLAILMSVQPKMKFANGRRTGEQDVSAIGVPKWAVQVSVADRETGQADLIKVTVTSNHNPAEAAQVGTPVLFENLGIGIMNGSPYFLASGLQSAMAAATNGRASKNE
jgi:hypothetical protein